MTVPPAPPPAWNLPVTDRSGLATYVFADFLQKLWVQLQAIQGAVTLLSSTVTIGTGNPNGVVVGSPPDLFLNTSGGAGTTLWVKESGNSTDSGWVGK